MIRTLLLWLSLLASFVSAQSFTAENASREEQTGWVTVPLPIAAPDGPRAGPGIHRAVVRDGVLYAKLTMAAGERRRVELQPGGATAPFALHPWIGDELDRLWPSFVAVEPDGDEHRSRPAWPRLIEAGPARWVWQLDTMVPEVPLVVRGYFYVFTDSPVIEYEIRTSYGTTAPGQPQVIQLESVRMEVGERPHVDFASRKGLDYAVRVGDRWHQTVSAPREWLRCRTIELTGALLCQPESDPYGLSADAMARIDGPLCGVADGWQGRFLAFGSVPNPQGQAWADRDQARARSAFEAGRTQVGDEMDPRPYGQPPYSGTTGNQADFGGRTCWLVRLDASPEPWALHDLRFSAQAWLLRPYANREPSGAPLTRAAHPDLISYNLAPYDRLSRDMAGWPVPSVWISGYTTSDSQHRSDNLLYGLWALTRSMSLRDTILDMLALQSCEVRREPGQWSGVGSPRGWGRPLVSLCHAYSLGFVQAEPMIRRAVADMWVARSYGAYPGAPVQTFSDNEGKYGWLMPDGKTLIRAWLPWQDAIAEMGLYAAWVQLRIPEARQMILDVAPSTIRWGFYMRDGQMKHCYAIAYDPALPGQPPPPSAFTPIQPNKQVFTAGDCASWTITAAHILLALGCDPATADLCRERIAAFGPPTYWGHACWWAL